MAVPLERPDPPVVGKVTHCSIELLWDHARKGDSSRRFTIQEEDPKSHQWGNVYTGYASTQAFNGLEPNTEYKYRLRVSVGTDSSEWSVVVAVSTTKEPLSGDQLHKAISLNRNFEIEALLDAGDVRILDIPDRHGLLPLMSAAQKGYLEIVESLIHYGASVDQQNENGKSALMLAAFEGRLQVVQELRYNGATYTMVDKSGCNALHYAVSGGHADVIQWMLVDGAIVDFRDTASSWTPLLRCASVGGNQRVAELLLRYGADPNAKDTDGKTALLVAVVNGHVELVELLLQKGADVELRNEFGRSITEMALASDRRRITALFQQHLEKLRQEKAKAP